MVVEWFICFLSRMSGVSSALWVVISGASQGLGATICTELAPTLPPHSVIIGMARSKQGLDNTASQVNKINPNVKVMKSTISVIDIRLKLSNFGSYS